MDTVKWRQIEWLSGMGMISADSELKLKMQLINEAIMDWKRDLTERDLKEVEFAQLYERDFGHGTVGHNQLLIIAKLAKNAKLAAETATGLTALSDREANRVYALVSTLRAIRDVPGLPQSIYDAIDTVVPLGGKE